MDLTEFDIAVESAVRKALAQQTRRDTLRRPRRLKWCAKDVRNGWAWRKEPRP